MVTMYRAENRGLTSESTLPKTLRYKDCGEAGSRRSTCRTGPSFCGQAESLSLAEYNVVETKYRAADTGRQLVSVLHDGLFQDRPSLNYCAVLILLQGDSPALCYI